MGPNTAFLLLVLGILAIEFECLRPGRVIPGLAGVALIITSLFSLWRNSPAGAGMLLLISAAVLFALEAIWDVYFVPAVVGSISLITGSILLFPTPRRIAPGLGVPAAAILASVTTYVAFAARKARQNKRSDL